MQRIGQLVKEEDEEEEEEEGEVHKRRAQSTKHRDEESNRAMLHENED